MDLLIFSRDRIHLVF